MQNNIFTLKEFTDVMNEWKLTRQYQDEINQVMRKYGDGLYIPPDCTFALQETLEKMFGDDNESSCGWIEYFVYELDFGKKYEDGMIKDGEGNYIKLATVADLYDVLIKELSERG